MGLLDGKVMIVTGAGGGIGREHALALALEGAAVVVNDLGGARDGTGSGNTMADQVVEEIRAAGGEATASYDDVSSIEGGQAILQAGLDAFDKVDGVVNNAGILRDVIFHKMTEDDWDSVINVHLKGSFNTSRAAATHFRQQQSGAFVHMTSTSGLIGNFGQANYAAAKLGIVGLSKSLALDMSRFNVRSNCISPFAWSRMIGTIPMSTPEEKARVEKIKQMTPDKISVVATALCADTAHNVTGQVFAVRNNEIFLMSQHRPLRGMQEGNGWTPESVVDHAFPAMSTMFYPLDRSADIFSWDPV